MNQAQINSIAPDIREDLDEAVPGWRFMKPDEVQEKLVEYKVALMRQADEVLDFYNDHG